MTDHPTLTQMKSNIEFMAFFIKQAKEKREQRRMEVVETFMACEAKDGVAS